MQRHTFDKRAGTPAARISIALALLLAACIAALLAAGGTASASIATKQEALAEVRDRQVALSDEIAASNDEINALIGQVSEARQAEEAAAAELAETEAELGSAQSELADGREHLAEVRVRLDRAIKQLEELLVGIYKSDDPDAIKVLMDSAEWEDASIDAAYLDRLNDYQQDTVVRVKVLRDEARTLVTQLTEARNRIAEVRDETAARHQELADTRVSLEAQEAELAAAREARKGTLSQLAGREVQLEDGIEAAELRQAREDAAPVPPEEPEPAPDPDVAAPAPSAPAPSGSTATLNPDGTATPPADAPPEVVAAIEAANRIEDMPYLWGGGHGSFEDSGYDCSGAVSYALNGGGFLSSPLDSTGFTYWGESGVGNWITVYANSGHVYVVIAGLRWDTSGTDGSGPSWSTSLDGYLDASAYAVRHPAGF